MTKTEAIEILRPFRDAMVDQHGCPISDAVYALDVAIETLKQPEPQWIPCSERLPKAFEFVNCTCHSLIDNREDWVIETVYVPQPSDSLYSDWGNIPMLNSGDCKVVAWMHRYIPEPYRGGEEE